MAKRRRFGSIRRLPSGRWQARFTAPNGATVTAPRTFAGKLDGEAWLADRRREIDAALWNPHAHRPQRTLFGVYTVRWLANRDLLPAYPRDVSADRHKSPGARVRGYAARRNQPGRRA